MRSRMYLSTNRSLGHYIRIIPTLCVFGILYKVKLFLCITNSALRHEGVWGNGYIDPRILDLGTSCRWSASRLGQFTPGERASGTHWIGSWVGPRTGLEDMEKEKFLPPPGLKLRPLGRPASSYTDRAIPAPVLWESTISSESYKKIVRSLGRKIHARQLVPYRFILRAISTNQGTACTF
jgi:hypothetical protein